MLSEKQYALISLRIKRKDVYLTMRGIRSFIMEKMVRIQMIYYTEITLDLQKAFKFPIGFSHLSNTCSLRLYVTKVKNRIRIYEQKLILFKLK